MAYPEGFIGRERKNDDWTQRSGFSLYVAGQNALVVDFTLLSKGPSQPFKDHGHKPVEIY